MGQQQGREEALKFIVTSMKMEINLQPRFWVYDHFLERQPERWWTKVRAAVEVQRERACAFPESVCSVLR